MGRVSLLAVRLRALCRRDGLTQTDMAEAVAVSQIAVNTIENRVVVPLTPCALKPARALGVPLETLFALAPDE